MTTQRERATPLAPAERRKAILDAVVPLLIEQGSSATTREMARIAGVAEGTIFRVFPDKSTLLHAAFGAVVDPGPVCDAIGRIPAAVPLRAQLVDAVAVLSERLERVLAIAGILRSLPSHASDHSADGHRMAAEADAAVCSALSDLFMRHRSHLAVAPARSAVALRSLVLSHAYPSADEDSRLSVDEIVDILLSGVLHRGDMHPTSHSEADEPVAAHPC